MKIVKINNGLGNQMFQYAFLYALRRKYNEKIKLDILDLKHDKKFNGYELDRVFNIKDDKINEFTRKYFLKIKTNNILSNITKNKLSIYIEENRLEYLYNIDLFKKKNISYYIGNFQSYLYFHNLYNEILQLYKFQTILNKKNEYIYNDIVNTNSVSIHVRRKDYLRMRHLSNICNIDYYNKSIKFINDKLENPKYFIFSDDHEWVKKNFKFNYELVNWNNNNNSYIDMFLMTKCKNNIIANSTFSWWGAYLNHHRKNIIICPKKWTNNVIDIESIYLNSWIKF